MAGSGPRQPIRAPMLSAPLLSLWSMATPPDPDELRYDSTGAPRWGNGVVLVPPQCGGGLATMVVGGTAGENYAAGTKPSQTIRTESTFDPFAAVGAETCGPYSRPSIDDFRAKAFANLEACWVQQLEYEFWTQTKVSANPGLTDAVDITPGGTAMAIVDAVAMIEEGMTDCSCGGQGMIHMTVRTYTLACAANLIVIPGDNPRGGVAMTKRGTLVVPGSGYPGSSPAGVFAANVEWIYATNMVKVFRGDPVLVPGSMEEALNRTTDQATFYAERLALFAYDPCCVLAVKVTAPGGGAS